jgi:hypothetical protein
MKIEVVTSFDQKYYNLIGKYAVASFLKNWPENIKLNCYVEDMNIENHEKINQIPFTALPETYFKFQNSSYKNRVKTFAKKGYSIIHALENIDCDFLIWIDADVITHAEVPFNFLKNLCLKDDLCTFMGVLHEQDNKVYFSCESSFFIVNKSHKNFLKFSNRYREYYDNELTENLRRFYDGEVLGATITDLKEFGNMKDLNPKSAHKTPMPRTLLNDYFKHLKAGLKEQVEVEKDMQSLEQFVLKIK